MVASMKLRKLFIGIFLVTAVVTGYSVSVDALATTVTTVVGGVRDTAALVEERKFLEVQNAALFEDEALFEDFRPQPFLTKAFFLDCAPPRASPRA